VLFVLFSAAGLYCLEYSVSPHGYYLDIPEGWKVLEAEDPQLISFTDPQRAAVFQIKTFPGDSFRTAEEIYQSISEGLGASGDAAGYTYNGRDAVFADLSFNPGGFKARGYFIFIEGEKNDIALLSFTPEEQYNRYHDFLLSCLDSFREHENAVYRPGPVSQFYYPFPGEEKKRRNFSVFGSNNTVLIDSGEIDASQVLIEREARVLVNFHKDRDSAWRRFYRQIYRDNYSRMEPLYKALKTVVGERGITRVELPAKLLAWVQNYSYSRTETFADILSPLEAALSLTGDCDSRGLVYITLLHYFGIDAILMVSMEYGHSVAAVDIEGKGARFQFEGTGYLIAETTEKVDLGLIASDMADPSGWVPVDLRM
jgi:hypothetical protein